MKRITLTGCFLALSFLACGGSEGPMSTTTTTSSSQTCNEHHLCINGSCKCTEGPKKDNTCCDPSDSSCSFNKCDTYCKYCQ